MRRLVDIAAVAAALLLLLAPRSASASDADDLFKQGVKLLDDGKVQEACTSFERSQALEPAAGTLLNLAGCYERLGKKASAVRTFQKARDGARSRGRADWESKATEHLRALASVPALTLRIREPGPVDVSIDGEAVPAAERDAPYPVDPGRHVVEARARSKRPFSVRIDVVGSIEVVVPVLEATATTQPADRERGGFGQWPPRRKVGLIVGGVGVAAIGFGVVSGLVANGALGDARANCPSYPGQCSSAASGPNDRAQTWSTIATVAVAGGAALGAAGAVLFFWPSPRSNLALGVTPAGQASLRGAF